MPPKVLDYMSRPVITVRSTDTLAHARNLMLRHNIGRLVVYEDNTIKGILSATDFVKIFAHPELARRPLNELVVRDIMSSNVISIEENESIIDAAKLMTKHNIGSLPVVNADEVLTGIITRADLTRAYAENYEGELKVIDVINKDPPIVSPFHTIHKVVEEMERKNYYRVVVVDAGKPIGVIARRDIIFLNPASIYPEVKYVKKDTLLPKGRTGAVRRYIMPLASDVMTPNPVTIKPNEDLASAASLMIKNEIYTLPVIDEEGALLGLISNYEIVYALTKV